MHTGHISRVTADAVDRVMAGEMDPEAAKSVADLARTEIANWGRRIEYARHTGRVASIPELEQTHLSKAA